MSYTIDVYTAHYCIDVYHIYYTCGLTCYFVVVLCVLHTFPLFLHIIVDLHIFAPNSVCVANLTNRNKLIYINITDI